MSEAPGSGSEYDGTEQVYVEANANVKSGILVTDHTGGLLTTSILKE